MKNEAEILSQEQAADLAALQAQAGGETSAGIEQGPAPADPGETWAILPAMLGSALAIAMPELRAVYSPEACRAWGDAMVPVAEKYGWNADGILGPELALVAASLPFAVGTFGAIQSRKSQAEKPQKAEKPEGQPAAPGSDSKAVIIGAPVAA